MYEFGMIIACPSCNARYAVDPAKIGTSGRTVKCAKCGHAWTQPGVDPDDEGLPPIGSDATPDEIRASLAAAQAEADAQADAGTEFGTANDGDTGGPFGNRDDDADSGMGFGAGFRDEGPAGRDTPRRGSLSGERRTNLPAVRKEKGKWPARIAWLGLCLVVGVVLGGTLAFRTEIVESWPASKRLYDAVGLTPAPPQIKFGVRAPKSDFMTVDGKKVLRVEGELVNQSTVTAMTPSLRVKFFDDAGKLIMNWRFQAPERRMLPGESVHFSTDIANPPSTARRIDVGIEGEPGGNAGGTGSGSGHDH